VLEHAKASRQDSGTVKRLILLAAASCPTRDPLPDSPLRRKRGAGHERCPVECPITTGGRGLAASTEALYP
jgi:hypothetical protein